MRVDPPNIDAPYRRYAELLLQHHRLLTADRDGGATEPVEDEMTRLWERLDAGQRQSLAGLASDLNWVRRGGQPAPRGRPALEVTAEDLRLLDGARAGSDWHRLLHPLRPCPPAPPPFQIAR